MDYRQVDQSMAAPNREALAAYLSENGFYETVGIGGSRFGNKTHTGSWCMGLRRLNYENTRGLALRTVLRAADLNMGEEIKKAFLEPMGLPIGSVRKGAVQYLEKEKRFLFPNGSMLQLGFCLKANDWEQHQGLQWDDLWLEEATQFPEDVINKLSPSVRPNNPRCPSRKLITCNPGGIGSEWVERRVINPVTRDRRTLWIKSSVKDNPIALIRDPGYILRELNSIQDPVLRAQWLDGDWDVQSGIYFRLNPETSEGPGTIRPMNVPYWADWYCGLDWGEDDPFSCVWVAHWEDDAGKPHLHVGGEVYRRGLQLDQQAELVLSHDKEMKRKYPFFHYPDIRMAGWDIAAPLPRESAEQTRTKASVWAMHGLVAYPAYRHSRTDGWSLIKYLIRKDILTIDPDCMALIKEFKGAVRAEGKEDLDQSRCADHCLIAGTMVATNRGEVPIEQVRVGDMVLTRKGYRPVAKSGMTFADTEVMTIHLSNGTTITGTPDHPIFVPNRGFVRLDALRYNEVLFGISEVEEASWTNSSQSSEQSSAVLKKLCSTVLRSAVILMRKVGHLGITLRRTDPFEGAVSDGFMKKSGSFTTGRFRRGMKSTTRISTRSIMPLIIFNAFPKQNISASTTSKGISLASTLWNGLLTLLNSATRRQSGIGVKRVESGTQSMGSAPGLIAKRLERHALSAASSSALLFQQEPSSVLANARRSGGINPGGITKNERVSFVASSIQSTNTNERSHAPITVVRRCESGRAAVYDLTVDDAHEFFANGVLVHNSLDALRYITGYLFGMDYAMEPEEDRRWDLKFAASQTPQRAD